MNRFLIWLLVLVVAGVGYAFYQQYRTQTQLDAQLYELDQLLLDDNSQIGVTAANSLKGIEAAVVKNQNQLRDVAVLRAAQNLNSQADSLAHSLHSRAEELLQVTGNRPGQMALLYPNKTQEVAELLGTNTAARQTLQQQVTAFVASLHTLAPPASSKLAVPAFEGLPVVAALAALTQLESDVRKAETETLQHLAKRVGAKRLNEQVRAFATAESNIVAPGETYRARMFLLTTLNGQHLKQTMRCNGQPVTVTSDGVGQVRFRAPQRPGPATWTGSIRFNQNGYDTTFQVRVPYRVAHR